jgi:hypothetical protein
MSHTTEELKTELKKNLDQLQKLRDEIRVRLHLAGMDAKNTWSKLEPRIALVEQQLQKATHELSDASRTALDDVIKALKKLRDSMH